MALLYALYKLVLQNDETKMPNEKVEPPPYLLQQKNRHNQNVSIIPENTASINANTRDVFIASRVVQGQLGGGILGLLEKYPGGVVKGIWTGGLSVLLDDAPDPTHHWCVVVGDYLHQLDAVPDGWNYYTNERFSSWGGWTKYKIGTTNFNDIAIRNAASNVMNEMPEKYNVFDNNCQHFAVRLVDKLLREGRKKLKTLTHEYISMPEKGAEEGEPTDELEQEFIEALKMDIVSVGDQDGEGAVVRNEQTHKEMMDTAVAFMVENTPSIKEGQAT